MKHTSYKWYWLAVLVTAVLCFTYVKQRKLEERYQGYQESEVAIQDLQRQVGQLQQQVEKGQERVQELASDPVEQEAAIRRWSRKLREGETVYHMDVAPVEPAPAATPAGEHRTEPSN